MALCRLHAGSLLLVSGYAFIDMPKDFGLPFFKTRASCLLRLIVFGCEGRQRECQCYYNCTDDCFLHGSSSNGKETNIIFSPAC
jgi:hypothetical protein